MKFKGKYFALCEKCHSGRIWRKSKKSEDMYYGECKHKITGNYLFQFLLPEKIYEK